VLFLAALVLGASVTAAGQSGVLAADRSFFGDLVTKAQLKPFKKGEVLFEYVQNPPPLPRLPSGRQRRSARPRRRAPTRSRGRSPERRR